MKAATNKQRCKNCAHKCVCQYQSYYENLEGVEKCKHYWSKQKAFESRNGSTKTAFHKQFTEN